MNQTITIGEVMTARPLSVSPQQKISDAKQLMVKRSIKHLPVVRDSRVIGILTDRDIKLRQAVSHSEDFHASARVENVCVSPPYMVTQKTLLSDALSVMTEKNIGSAIVVDNDQKLLGIFTNMDACRVLLEVLQNPSEPAN